MPLFWWELETPNEIEKSHFPQWQNILKPQQSSMMMQRHFIYLKPMFSLVMVFLQGKRDLWTLSLNHLPSIYSPSVSLVEVYEILISLSQKNSVLVVPSGDCLNLQWMEYLFSHNRHGVGGPSSWAGALASAITDLHRGWETLAPASVVCFVKLQ